MSTADNQDPETRNVDQRVERSLLRARMYRLRRRLGQGTKVAGPLALVNVWCDGAFFD